jgi:uridylate kinase
MSVGGSVLVPEADVRVSYIRQFSALMKQCIQQTHQQTAIITGGGGPTRMYQRGMKEIGITDLNVLDIMGIRPTHDNAVFLAYALNHEGVKAQYISSLSEHIDRTCDAWVTGGTIPGQTSDAVLVDWSNQLGISTLINATNTPYVYEIDRNGRIDTTRPITEMTWDEYIQLMGDRQHKPGENLPFGITASRKSRDLGLSVVILDGNNLDNLLRVFEGKPAKGTVIHT